MKSDALSREPLEKLADEFVALAIEAEDLFLIAPLRKRNRMIDRYRAIGNEILSRGAACLLELFKTPATRAAGSSRMSSTGTLVEALRRGLLGTSGHPFRRQGFLISARVPNSAWPLGRTETLTSQRIEPSAILPSLMPR